MNVTASDSLNETTLTRGITEIAVIGVTEMVICLLALLGNAAVIFAILRCSKLRQEPSNLFLLNLAVTDLLTALLVMVSSFAAVVHDGWPFGQGWCDIVCVVNYLFIIVSMLTLCMISIDRYQAVTYPLRYTEHVTEKKVLLAIAFTWLQGLAISVVPAFFRWIQYDYWEMICAIEWYENQQEAVYYVIFAFVSCFFAPGVILLISYSRILKVACRKKQINTDAKIRSSERYSASIRAINSLIVVVIMYVLCMTPFSVTKLYNVMVDKNNMLPRYTYVIASLAAFLSSAINPLIYGILRKDFQDAFGIPQLRRKQSRMIFNNHF